MNTFNKYLDKLFDQKDITSLVIFRIAFGIIMLWEVVRYVNLGRVERYYIDAQFTFTYDFFEWVKPWEGNGMFIHFYVLGILSVFMIIGLFYRITAFFIFLLFTYIFLLEEANYLNHFYLVSLISFLMIFVPAHKKYSVDAFFWKKIKSDVVPAWSYYLLQLQMGVVYFFGGIAKLNSDWMLRAEPMQHWLYYRTDYPFIGQFFEEKWMAYVMSWSGACIDLFAAFLLLNRKTRPFMFLALVTFHFMNDRLFNIGIFPWFGIMATTIFFPSDYLKRVIQTGKSQKNGIIMLITAFVFSYIGMFFHQKQEIVPFMVSFFVGGVIAWLFIDLFENKKAVTSHSNSSIQALKTKNYAVIALVSFWTIFQVGIPLRHFVIPGNVSWTEEGHRFSWHMKLRSKSGDAKFYAYNPETDEFQELNTMGFLTERQYSKMSTRPYMILEFAKFLKQQLVNEGLDFYEIRVVAYSSYNYRLAQQLVRSDIDLSKQTYSDFKRNDWVFQIDPKLKPIPIKDSKSKDVDEGDMGE
jgi:vitamin K-dependent gamma-carboxylase